MKLSLASLLVCGLSAQVPNNAPPPQPGESQPIFRVTVVERTTNAVSYRHRSGWTKVDLHGTPLAPKPRPRGREQPSGLHRSENADASSRIGAALWS